MNPKDLHGELMRLFEEQGGADEASAPDFRELMARARAGTKDREVARAREGRWAWGTAVAAALSVALATGLFLLRRPHDPREPPNAPALADWKAPTDVLLQTPGAELLARLPVLLPSVPVGDAGEGAPGAREGTPPSTQTNVPHTKGVES